MKIKDTKIADKLPKEIFDAKGGEIGYDKHQGEKSYKKRILNTDIDINDIVELDVEKVKKAMVGWVLPFDLTDKEVEGLAKAIAEAKPFKEKK